MESQLLLEKKKILWAAEPKNYTGAAMAAKWVSLKNYQWMTIIIQTGAWAAGTAAVTLSQATAVAGTGSKALAFSIPFQWNDEATSGTLVKTAVVSDTFTIGTANKIYVIEVNPASLDVAGGFDCVTLAIASPGVNADFYGVQYILGSARYAADTPPSALVD